MKDDSEIKKHICRKGLINERLTHAFEAEKFIFLDFLGFYKTFL